MLLLIVLIVILLVLFWLKPVEHYRVPEPEAAEFVQPDMSLEEYRKMTKWIYPGYLNDA